MARPACEAVVAGRGIDGHLPAVSVEARHGDGRDATAFLPAGVRDGFAGVARGLGLDGAELEHVVAHAGAVVRHDLGMAVRGCARFDQDRPAVRNEIHVTAILVIVLIEGMPAAHPYARAVPFPTVAPVHTRRPFVCGEEWGSRIRSDGRQRPRGESGEVVRGTVQIILQRPACDRIAGTHGRQGQERPGMVRRAVRAARVETVDYHVAGLKVMHEPRGEVLEKRMIDGPAIAGHGHGVGRMQHGRDRELGVAEPFLEFAMVAMCIERAHEVGHAKRIGIGMRIFAEDQAGAHESFRGKHPLVRVGIVSPDEPTAFRVPIVHHARDLAFEQLVQTVYKLGTQTAFGQQVQGVANCAHSTSRGQPVAVFSIGGQTIARRVERPSRPLQRRPRRHLIELRHDSIQELWVLGEPVSRRQERQFARERVARGKVRHGQGELFFDLRLELFATPVEPRAVLPDFAERMGPANDGGLRGLSRGCDDRFTRRVECGISFRLVKQCTPTQHRRHRIAGFLSVYATRGADSGHYQNEYNC